MATTRMRVIAGGSSGIRGVQQSRPRVTSVVRSRAACSFCQRKQQPQSLLGVVDGRRVLKLRVQAVEESKEQQVLKQNAEAVEEFLPASSESVNETSSAKFGQAALVALSVMSVAPDAFAKGGELGILEGRTIALLHPAAMFSLLALTGYLGYSGWQWRRVRTVGDEISELKKQVKKKEPQLVAASGAAEVATEDVSSPMEEEITNLQETRKKLIEGKFRDKHFMWGSLLLGAGVTFSIEGCLNTFSRTGKLFPGPHLWAGAGITALWAIAAALVPSMQKGNKTARDAHIALNGLSFLLFLWQVPTGLEIVGKVFQFTKWP